MSIDEIRDKYSSGKANTDEAFEELCALFNAMEAEREERREVITAKFTKLKTANALLKEKNATLRGKYIELLAAYNELAEEAREKSDSSSSSSSSDDDGDCTIM